MRTCVCHFFVVPLQRILKNSAYSNKIFLINIYLTN